MGLWGRLLAALGRYQEKEELMMKYYQEMRASPNKHAGPYTKVLYYWGTIKKDKENMNKILQDIKQDGLNLSADGVNKLARSFLAIGDVDEGKKLVEKYRD